MASHPAPFFHLLPERGTLVITGLQLTQKQMHGPVGKKILDDAGAQLENVKENPDRFNLGMQAQRHLARQLDCLVLLAYVDYGNDEGDEDDAEGYYMIVPKYHPDEIFDEAKKLKFEEAAKKACGVDVKWETMRNLDQEMW